MCVLRDITKPRNVSDSRHTQPADRQTLANLAPQKFKKLPPPAAHSIPQLQVAAHISLPGNQQEGVYIGTLLSTKSGNLNCL